MKPKNMLMACLVLILLSGLFYQPAVAAESSALICTMRHTVQRGETIRSIANQYQVSWRWLVLVNKIANPDKLRVGQALCVQLSTRASTQLNCTQYHTVQRGETIAKIAQKYGIDASWIVRINRLDDPDHIYAGNRICVQTASGAPPAQQNSEQKIPTFSVSSVVRDSTVTIKTYNLPANRTFNVYMGRMGTRGEGGALAGTIESGNGDSLVVTIVIPAAVQGLNQIAIRLESTTGGYYAYNWFYNR